MMLINLALVYQPVHDTSAALLSDLENGRLGAALEQIAALRVVLDELEQVVRTEHGEGPETVGFLTAREAAVRLGVSHGRVRQYITDGRLPAARHGDVWLIKASDVASFRRPLRGWVKGRKRAADA